MKVYFEKRILGGFILAIIILTGLGIYTYSNSQKSIQASRMIAHTNEVLFHIEQINSSLLTIEAELLRFNILGDTSFLKFYKNQVIEASKHVQKLQAISKDNFIQQQHIANFRKVGRRKVEHIQRVIEAKLKSPKEISPLIPSVYNRSVTLEVKEIIANMKLEELKLLEARMEAREGEVRKFNVTFITLQVFIGVILFIVFLAINDNLRRRIKAEDSLKDALSDVRDLYDNAPCGYHSLDGKGYFIDINKTLLKWIGYTKEEVIGRMTFLDIITEESEVVFNREFPAFKEQGFINNIEFDILRKDGSSFPIVLSSTADIDEHGKFIRSRSSTFDNTERKLAENKIMQLNQELEAFTYSVSHDLRAPLRSIDGYAKMLREDYATRIDTEGNRLIDVIVRNAIRMGHLIDDLLDFSRIGRKEITKSKVDINSIIESIKNELLEQEKRTNIELIVHKLESAFGDPNMLRQVWINLISNALKYSRGQDQSRIEIMCHQQDGNIVYSIRDNGVGFDMKYSNKLFGVFQRLHKIQDFEGTGVGLALVHRIVTRHGGRIWADAKVNEGATFFFFISTELD